MKKLFFIVFALLGFCFINALHLELKGRVFISEKHIKLGQITKFIDGNKETFKYIKETKILELPYETKYRNINSSLVERIIQETTGKKIKVSGGLCVIRWEQKQISKEEIDRYLDIFVKHNFKIAEKYDIKVLRYPKVSAPIKNYDIKFVINNTNNHGDYLKIMGSINCDDKETNKFVLDVKINVHREAIALKVSKRRNQTITENDLIKTIRTSSLFNDNFLKIQDIENIITSKYLARGSVLTTKNTKKIPDVKRGNVTNVKVKNGLILISLEAIAKKEGYIGDKIMFENPKNRKKFYATITNKNEAFINLGGK